MVSPHRLALGETRKELDMVEKLMEISELKGWRKLKHLYRNTNLA